MLIPKTKTPKKEPKPLKRSTKPLKRSAIKAKPPRPKRAPKIGAVDPVKKESKATKLRAFAENKECTLHLSGICNRNPETTVLCHVKPKGYGSMGSKPNDFLGVHACSSCHDAIDGRNNRYRPTDQDRYADLLRAMLETQHRVIALKLVDARDFTLCVDWDGRAVPVTVEFTDGHRVYGSTVDAFRDVWLAQEKAISNGIIKVVGK